jgi:hypothetical protein
MLELSESFRQGTDVLGPQIRVPKLPLEFPEMEEGLANLGTVHFSFFHYLSSLKRLALTDD